MSIGDGTDGVNPKYPKETYYSAEMTITNSTLSCLESDLGVRGD